MQQITSGRGSHWSWLGDLIGVAPNAGLVVKIEDVSELLVTPLPFPPNGTNQTPDR